MKTRVARVLAMLMALCMLLSACGQQSVAERPNNGSGENLVQNPQDSQNELPGGQVTDLSATVTNPAVPEKGTYNEGVALVKYDGQLTQQMVDQLGCVSAEPLYAGASWYALTLPADVDTVEKVAYLRELGCFEAVDYDFIMKTETADPENLEPGQEVASGTCGENLTWMLDDNGTLTISGTGAMYDYTGAWNSPWYYNRSNVVTVVIQPGVTTIGYNAFFTCTNLKMVVIPESVTKIDRAFASCNSFCHVLYSGTFEKWLDISITDGNDWITKTMRHYNYSGSGDVHLVDGYCDLCARTNVIATGSCGENLTWRLTEDGKVTISGYGAMSNFISGHSPWYDLREYIYSVEIEEGATTVGNEAFYYCYQIKSVTLPNSLDKIGEYSFYYCNSLTKLVIPENVTEISSNAFASCGSMESIVIPNQVTSVGDHAFRDCISLVRATIGTGITRIGNCLFYHCPLLEQIEIPASVSSIGTYAFAACDALRKIVFLGNAPTVEEMVFNGVTATAYYPANNPTWTEEVMQQYGGTITWEGYVLENIIASGECGENVIWQLTEDGVLTISGTGKTDDYATESNDIVIDAPWYAWRDSILSVVVQEGVTHVGSGAFRYCKNLTTASLPHGLENISTEMFFDCTSLSSVNIPDTVGAIWASAFKCCTSLTSITFPDSMEIISSYAFAQSGLTQAVLPKNVYRVWNGAFASCVNLKTVVLGSGVAELGEMVFAWCDRLETVYFTGSAPSCSTRNNFSNTTIYYPEDNETWTEEYREGLGEGLTWIPYDGVPNISAPEFIMPNTDQQEYLENQGVTDAWEYLQENGKNPGGSPDVIIAIIDTGVDYNHIDLRNNIWVNPAEIPDNGIDDDGNGYVDDVFGWNCVGDNNDPMDDNGHGTHVAGIVAAENNSVGGVGIAHNCKIMVLKAGNSSGFFNSSDIAEAIQYAYMNGASVINMSFGGSSISIAVEEALKAAYNQCVLVAAAGNSGLCNQPGCPTCPVPMPCYPAALPYVIGVMSCNAEGSMVSAFSNYDHWPYNNIEYEVYAVGEAVYSCWPGNKYATLNGTSMASPTVAAIAALLRSYYADREMYSSKFIQSQIVNTGSITLLGGHGVANAYEALTQIPKPAVSLFDYYIDDSTAISEKNNGNGIMDAGETVRLYVSLMNRGGMASNVTVSIDTMRNNDPALTDPYFTFGNTTVALSDIGTYSVREAYEDEYFEIAISPNCPNDYLVDFNIRFTYTNGLDEADTAAYSDEGVAQFRVSRGFYLPSSITEDTVFTADRLYIVGDNVTIAQGVTVTFEEGCRIQFYDDREYYNSPRINVYGNLIFAGSEENMIHIAPSEKHATFRCEIFLQEGHTMHMAYTEFTNGCIEASNYWVTDVNKEHSSITYSKLLANSSNGRVSAYYEGRVLAYECAVNAQVGSISNCFINNYAGSIQAHTIDSNYIVMEGPYTSIEAVKFTNNTVLSTLNVTGGIGTRKFYIGYCSEISNSLFLSTHDNNPYALVAFVSTVANIVSNTAFSAGYQKYASQIIEGYYDSTGTPTVDVYGSLADASKLWPYVVGVEMFDKNGDPITRVGNEEIKVRVTFNRPMDTTQDTFATFGTIEPYADYKIEGEYISETVWEGTYTLKAQMENGQNFLKINNACAKEDPTKTVFGEYQLHEFTIDTTAAMSMNLQATPTRDGINLTWFQDDYDTLLGYNIYRSEEKDGNFVKLNPAILLPSDESFLDENAEPGKTYWYTYTVVLTDFTESAPAGKVMATAMDTIQPNLYHTPVNQGYLNNNLVISCTARDNMAIASVVLYYRTAGATQWKTLTMSKQNDKFSATIFGSELTMDGMEYYIVASDGINTIAKGSAETPYAVVIKDASAISRLGDVDGDGVITAKDALMIMQAIEGKRILSDDQFQRADLNKNGTLDSVEVLRILQYVNGNVTDLDMTK